MQRFWQKGASELYVVIVVIIGAFLLAGGTMVFQNIMSSDAFTGGLSGGSPSGSSGSGTWSIVTVTNTCDNTNHIAHVSFALHGTAAGFYRIDIKNGSTYAPITITDESGKANTYTPFTPNSDNIQDIQLNLLNSDGYNTDPWRITLYQGGAPNGTDLPGGTQQAQQDMNATGCQ